MNLIFSTTKLCDFIFLEEFFFGGRKELFRPVGVCNFWAISFFYSIPKLSEVLERVKPSQVIFETIILYLVCHANVCSMVLKKIIICLAFNADKHCVGWKSNERAFLFFCR